MNKFAIAILFSAGTLISVQAQASDRTVIGAVDGALIGSYYGGAHGAVAGAIIGAAIGNSTEHYDDRRVVNYQERGYARVSSSPVYYGQPAYETYYEPRYEPRYEAQRVVYVQPPVYESYPVIYSGYRAPVYSGYYSAPYRSYHVSHQAPRHASRHGYSDRRGRY